MPQNQSLQRALYIPLIILAWLAVILIAGWLLGHILKTVLTLVLSGVLAYALTPLVDFFSRRMPRPFAIGLAYVVGMGLVLGLGAIIVYQAADQVTSLVHQLPSYFNHSTQWQHRILKLLPFHISDKSVAQAKQQALHYLQDIGTSTATQSISIVTGVVGTVVDIVLVIILSVYFTSDGHRLASALRRETPRSQRIQVNLFIAIFNQVVGGYIRGQLTLAALIGLLVGVGMLFLAPNYAILLGVLAFFMEFIPVIGVLISGAVSVLLALTNSSHPVLSAVLVLLYFVFVHVIEGDVVGPRIMGRAVGIHPATALVALVAGTELFGVWGALFAAPAAGLLQAVGTATWRELQGTEPEVVLQAVADKAAEHAQTEVHEEKVELASKSGDKSS